MANGELLDELNERLGRATNELTAAAGTAVADHDFRYAEHLLSKRAGLMLVKDWLRVYR